MRISPLIATALVAVLSLSACSGTTPTDTGSTPAATSAPSASASPSEAAAKPTEAASAERKPDSEYYPVTIQTYDNEAKPIEVTFKEAPKKVVAVYQSPTETLLALGLGDRIINASGFDTDVAPNLKDEFAKIGKVQENAPDKETVLNLEPDFITGWYGLFLDDGLGDVKPWIDRGINTYMQQNSGPIYLIGREGGEVKNPLFYELDDIRNMGKIFNREAEAEALIAEMETAMDTAAKAVEDKPKVTAMVIETSGDGKIRVYGDDSIGGDIVKRVGGDLVGGKNATIGKEDLVKLNPEVIFVVYYGDELTSDKAVSFIAEDKALASLKAVTDKRVLPIVLSEVYSTGVRTIDGIHTVIKGLYPEAK